MPIDIPSQPTQSIHTGPQRINMRRIGVLTSGGDAPGMNAAVRAVVRAALDLGVEIFAVYEGYRGMIDNNIHPMNWDSVGGILHQGGTIIGSARCSQFREVEGRRLAAKNLIERGIQGLIIIGGDGSLTGANLLKNEWRDHVQSLREAGEISEEQANQHDFLGVVGLVGSIDNDMFGTAMTIGADTALHRIVDAIDSISSTAASHQRAFVIEVMGRRCGYLALVSAIASGADWALIPESPPNLDNWEDKMCDVLKAGREAGRRDSIVVVAEGAIDRHGNPITCGHVKQAIEERMSENVRVTILGHVQRGGSPSAFDRNLSTLLGVAAVDELLQSDADSPAYLMGLVGNRVQRSPLMDCVAKTHAVNEAITNLDFERAMDLRGTNYKQTFRTLRTLVRALPHPPIPGKRRLRIAVLNADAPAPGMNTAVRAAVRIGIDEGHHIVGVRRGFAGLVDGELFDMEWMSVNGWGITGGSELGTTRRRLEGSDFYKIARRFEEQNIDALMMVGGWSGYAAAQQLYEQRTSFPAFNIPIICLPASIDNNLPGSELSVGADTALNSIVDALDKIKQSAVASHRCFIVEVMGGTCGYLALMSTIATGAERVYLHEEGVRLPDLLADLELLVEGFEHGKRLGVMIRNEKANPVYTTQFIADLFEQEGGSLFEVRTSILGHLQQGGMPTPFDRVQATRMAVRCIEFIQDEAENAVPNGGAIGLMPEGYRFTPFDEFRRLYEVEIKRPRDQWWMTLRPVARLLAQPSPQFRERNQFMQSQNGRPQPKESLLAAR